jgi:MFS family permease
MGYMVDTAVLVVSFDRIRDMFRRVKMYAMRIVQGVGGATIMANSTAVITDAFPGDERDMAWGINSLAGIAGSFIGLIAGGLLAAVDWHLIFYVWVPIGLFGTVWAYRSLREIGKVEGATLLPDNFSYTWFARLVLADGLAMGLFAAPNTAGTMTAVLTSWLRGAEAATGVVQGREDRTRSPKR